MYNRINDGVAGVNYAESKQRLPLTGLSKNYTSYQVGCTINVAVREIDSSSIHSMHGWSAHSC